MPTIVINQKKKKLFKSIFPKIPVNRLIVYSNTNLQINQGNHLWSKDIKINFHITSSILKKPIFRLIDYTNRNI